MIRRLIILLLIVGCEKSDEYKIEEEDSKIKEDPVKVEELVTKLGVNLQVLMDKYGKVAEKYGVKSLPRLVVIDQKSKVHYIHDGYAPGDENKLKDVLNKLADAKK